MRESINQTARELWLEQKKSFEAIVDGVPVPFLVEGKIENGRGPCPTTPESDPLSRAPWHKTGYVVAPFLANPSIHAALISGIEAKVRTLLREAGVSDLNGFHLSAYHRYAERAPEAHKKVLGRIVMPIPDLPIDPGPILERIRELCGAPHGPQMRMPEYGYALIRIIRPSSQDHLAPHRDAYASDQNRKFIVNAYIPIAGSDDKSSLPLIPGSHLWPESELKKTALGAKCNGLILPVPAITHAARGLKFIRPNPGDNQILLFSPHLIHGAGVNFHKDKTRVSLEIKLATRSDKRRHRGRRHASPDEKIIGLLQRKWKKI